MTFTAFRTSKGIRFMVLSAVFFSLMGLFVRLLKGIPFMEILVVRSAVSFIISAVLLGYGRRSFFGRNRLLLLARGAFGFLALAAYFYTIGTMPLAEAVTIQYTNPLFTALFSSLVLHERARTRDILASIVAFAGVVIIAHPANAVEALPAAVGLAGAMCSGVAYTLVRRLGLQGEDPLTIVLYFPFVALVFGAPFAAAGWIPPVAAQWALLLGVGIAAQIGQVALTRGLARLRAGRATVVNYLVIALSTFYSLLLQEPLRPETFAGMLLILAGVYLVSRAPADGDGSGEFLATPNL